MEMNAEAYAGKVGIIVALEGVEMVGAHLCAAVAAPQIVFKQYRHFLHHRVAVLVAGGGYLKCCDEVFFSVGTHFADWKLGAGDDDGLVQVLEHKTQRGGGVCHRVGAVKHHKAVVAGIVLLDALCNFNPVRRIHV